MSIQRWFVSSMLAVLASGCIGVSGAQRARTLGEGRWQHGAGLSLQGNYAPPPGEPPLGGEPTGEPMPQGTATVGGLVELYTRYGLLEQLDVGLRLGGAYAPGAAAVGSVHAELKWQFVSTGGLDVSVAPSLGVTAPQPFVSVQVPLLFGVALGSGYELVLSPRVTKFVGSSGLGASGSVGLVVPLGSMAVIPEVVVGKDLAGTGLYAQAGLAFLLGDPPKAR